MTITSFPPIVSKNAGILILGSMPGKTSLQQQEYYTYSGNVFWDVLEPLLTVSKNAPYQERVKSLNRNGIAVWDVLKHCEREGSLDSNIRDASEVPNDFVAFLQAHQGIKHIFFNGKKAEGSFQKHVWTKLPDLIRSRVTLLRLPSTSSANTHLSKHEKQEEWQKCIAGLFQTLHHSSY